MPAEVTCVSSKRAPTLIFSGMSSILVLVDRLKYGDTVSSVMS